MPRYCQSCRGVTPSHPVKSCPNCGIAFDNQPTRRIVSSRGRVCEYQRICAEYLSSLKWEESYFNRSFNHCYCPKCYLPRYKDTFIIEETAYVIPRGWCRFGLRVDNVRAKIDNIWEKWVVSYHGTNRIAAQSIVAHRQFLVPGDVCIDGSTIGIREGHIKDKNEIYTSPTIAYSSLPAYCPRVQFRSNITNKTYYAKMVLQCRQKPGTYTVQGETVDAQGKRICQFIPNDQLEFFTTTRSAIVTYGLLIQLTEI